MVRSKTMIKCDRNTLLELNICYKGATVKLWYWYIYDHIYDFSS